MKEIEIKFGSQEWERTRKEREANIMEKFETRQENFLKAIHKSTRTLRSCSACPRCEFQVLADKYLCTFFNIYLTVNPKTITCDNFPTN